MKKNILGKIQLKSLKIIRMSEGNIIHVLKKRAKNDIQYDWR